MSSIQFGLGDGHDNMAEMESAMLGSQFRGIKYSSSFFSSQMGMGFVKGQQVGSAGGVFGQAGFAQKRMFFTRNSNYNNELLYNILEVQRNASDSEIKKSFFNLAKKYHPDVNKTKEAKGKYFRITQAYDTLSDRKKRRIYDTYGMNANEQENSDIDFDRQFGTFSSYFSSIFNGGNMSW